MKPGPSFEVIQRIEGIEKAPVAEVLDRCYIREQWSYRNLCERWRLNTRTLMRLLRHFGIKPRKGGDAVRAQWVHAPEERRIKTSKAMKRMVTRMNREGRHPRLGKTKETDPGTHRTAEKLRKSTSARRPEVKVKAAVSHRLFIRRNPAEHATSKLPPTRAESLMLDHVRSLGFKAIHNHIAHTDLGPKWLNVFIPRLNLAIGCESYGRFPLDWRRHAAVSVLGIRQVFITNRRIRRGQWEGLDQYIACLKSVRPHPTAHGQNTVIWGRRNTASFEHQPDEVAVEAVSVNGCHELIVTTTPDDPVLRAYRGDVPPS